MCWTRRSYRLSRCSVAATAESMAVQETGDQVPDRVCLSLVTAMRQPSLAIPAVRRIPASSTLQIGNRSTVNDCALLPRGLSSSVLSSVFKQAQPLQHSHPIAIHLGCTNPDVMSTSETLSADVRWRYTFLGSVQSKLPQLWTPLLGRSLTWIPIAHPSTVPVSDSCKHDLDTMHRRVMIARYLGTVGRCPTGAGAL